MNYPTAIVVAAALIASASLSQPLWGQAQVAPTGQYQLVSQDNTGNAWVLNTLTGRLRLCLPPSQDDFSQAPECYAWTK